MGSPKQTPGEGANFFVFLKGEGAKTSKILPQKPKRQQASANWGRALRFVDQTISEALYP